jgi:hypothetical protein
LKNLWIPLAAAALAGCSATGPQQQSQVAGTTCWKELPTGSNLPVTKCMTEEERQRQKQEVEAYGDAINRATPNKTRGSGGT